MNPIYKFQLSAGSVTQRAFPTYKDDLAKDFEKEPGQEFFRAKLSGNLTFQSNDYTFIVSQAFDTQFVLEIFISYNAGQSWTSYWRGTFWKTDCEFDNDAETVTVQPSVWDQYNDVLAGLDKEYNLIELAPEIVPVKADKRPMIQVYVPGQSVIGCFLSGMWWEQEVEPESDETKLVSDFHFSLNKKQRILDITQTGGPALPDFVMGEPDENQLFDIRKDGYRFRVFYDDVTDPDNPFYMWDISLNNVRMWSYKSYASLPNVPYSVTLSPVASDATGDVTLYVHDLPVYSRFVCDTKTIVMGDSTLNTYEIPADDIVENNRNYHYVIGYYFPDTIIFSSVLVSTPTQWGLYQPGQYYYNPIAVFGEAFPVARNAWGRISIWFAFSSLDWIVEKSARQPFTIRHAYPLSSVISVLLAKIAPDITHAGTTDYSQFLYGQNLIGVTQMLFITPKSNLVTAGYDQPAQKAPITLKNVLDMLRDCFRCYWFIDGQNRFRIEHIQYFHNGGSYSVSPVVGIDLTTQQVPRNGKEWAFARNQYKFDKPEMAARYQFGWMDDVTQLFEGYPIDIISKYVNSESIEQIDVSHFTSDIDYILLNPGAISKDGFVLLSCVSYQSEQRLYDSSNFDGKIWDGSKVEAATSDLNGFVIKVSPNSEYPVVVNGSIVSIWAFSSIPTIGVGDNAIERLYLNNGKIVTKNEAQYLLITVRISLFTSLLFTDNYATGDSGNHTLELPYINFPIDGNDHYLQNAYVAFCFLQQYYAYDMPAPSYEINGKQMNAYGVKKLKNQTLRFPVLNDPNLMELVKTNLGNGTIEKLSVNLSSRNANATLKYDTE